MPSFELEREAGYPQIKIAGTDEVGRGCLAGPVFAAAVVIPDEIRFDEHPWLADVADSKTLSEKKRESLVPLIQQWSAAWCVGVASVLEIDSINIFQASQLAMVRSIEGLSLSPGHVLVDGKFLPKDLTLPATAVVKGDHHSMAIACASIIAKVSRDQFMKELDAQYPGYALGKHKGYPTRVHLEALEELGVTPIHRRSFAPIRHLLT